MITFPSIPKDFLEAYSVERVTLGGCPSSQRSLSHCELLFNILTLKNVVFFKTMQLPSSIITTTTNATITTTTTIIIMKIMMMVRRMKY